MGMSSFFVHTSPTIFKDPEKFVPDRWLGEEAAGLEKWLVAFSKGPRSCLGLNLAWCELYYLFAGLVRRYDMKVDVKMERLVWRDCFTPFYEEGQHLRVFCEGVKD